MAMHYAPCNMESLIAYQYLGEVQNLKVVDVASSR